MSKFGDANDHGWDGYNNLVSTVAHAIADAQGDAYAEYASEFDGYAKAAVDALKANLAGLSTNGINVWGSPADIKAVMRALYSDSIIENVRTQGRHWREECGKVDADRRQLLEALKALVREHIKRGPFDEPLGTSEQSPEINAALAAIAKAEKRP